jgi:hypothetical protein
VENRGIFSFELRERIVSEGCRNGYEGMRCLDIESVDVDGREWRYTYRRVRRGNDKREKNVRLRVLLDQIDNRVLLI